MGQRPVLFGPKPCGNADQCPNTELSFPSGLGEAAGFL